MFPDASKLSSSSSSQSRLPIGQREQAGIQLCDETTVRNQLKEREVETYKVDALQPSALSDLRARPSTILASVCIVLPRLPE